MFKKLLFIVVLCGDIILFIYLLKEVQVYAFLITVLKVNSQFRPLCI
jgi:hypothetical protein